MSFNNLIPAGLVNLQDSLKTSFHTDNTFPITKRLILFLYLSLTDTHGHLASKGSTIWEGVAVNASERL